MDRQKQAFTLVELIVVITILAILGTIAFISLQGYSINSRDSVRISDISKINLALELQLTKAGRIFTPENKINITASGTVILYQGEMSERIMSNIGVSGGGIDPLDDKLYTYSTNSGLTKYQLMGFLENGENISYIPKTYAITKERVPYVKGNELGILLDRLTKEPVHETLSTIDIVNTNIEYEIYLGNENDDKIIGTGSKMITSLYATKEYIGNKELAKYDSNLVLYFDMETTIFTGGLSKIRDFSGYGNDGGCYSGVYENCGENIGPLFTIGKEGKALKFGNIGGFKKVISKDSDSLNIKTNEFTVSLWFNLDKDVSEMSSNYPILLYKRPYKIGGYATHFVKSTEALNIQYCFPGSCHANFIGGLERNKWYHYVGIKTETALFLYIEGKLIVDKEVTDNIGDSSGIDLSLGDTFEGLIDEVRIYNRALSEKEIKVLYNSIN